MSLITVAVLIAGAGSAAAGSVAGTGQSWSAPMQEGRPIDLGGVAASVGAPNPDALEAAEAILDREEATAGRPFDPAFREGTLATLAFRPLDELQAVLSGPGGVRLPSMIGDSQADLVYTPVAPCRIIDTRAVGGPIPSFGSRNFRATGTNFSAQGGTSGSCGIPFGPATVVVINFGTRNAPGAGNLAVVPFGVPFGSNATVNFGPGMSGQASNGLPVAICNPAVSTCTFDISILANNSSTDLVADVQGYFSRPVATPLHTVFSVNSFSCPSLNDCQVSIDCAAGFTITGGGCALQFYSFEFFWANSSLIGPAGAFNGWNCQGTNASSVARVMRAYSVCARINGR